MSEVTLEKSNNLERRDTTRTNTHWPLAFSRPEDLTNASLMENKKATVLERLEHAIEKLKDGRKEIHEAVLAAIEMKEAGDDIADQIMAAMVAQTAIRNAETTMGQTQTKIEHHKFWPKNVGSQAKVEKMGPCKEAEKPLYLARYE